MEITEEEFMSALEKADEGKEEPTEEPDEELEEWLKDEPIGLD